MTPENKLWQKVLMQVIIDATFTGTTLENCREKKASINWITKAGKDFHTVCNLAGMDPDFVRDSFLAGRVDGELLRSAQGWHKKATL
jgi:hypothetical protein